MLYTKVSLVLVIPWKAMKGPAISCGTVVHYSSWTGRFLQTQHPHSTALGEAEQQPCVTSASGSKDLQGLPAQRGKWASDISNDKKHANPQGLYNEKSTLNQSLCNTKTGKCRNVGCDSRTPSTSACICIQTGCIQNSSACPHSDIFPTTPTHGLCWLVHIYRAAQFSPAPFMPFWILLHPCKPQLRLWCTASSKSQPSVIICWAVVDLVVL